jgi:hypothetical protein
MNSSDKFASIYAGCLMVFGIAAAIAWAIVNAQPIAQCHSACGNRIVRATATECVCEVSQ